MSRAYHGHRMSRNGAGGGPGALEELDERDVSVRMMEVGVGSFVFG